MKALWLGIVVMLLCGVPVWGQQDVVFYDDLETGDTAGWWAPARVGATGQVTCYDDFLGTPIACAGTGQDGDLLPGVGWPNPRFVDNGDGTVTDMLTGLFWLKNANCFGTRNWTAALADANTLASGAVAVAEPLRVGEPAGSGVLRPGLVERGGLRSVDGGRRILRGPVREILVVNDLSRHHCVGVERAFHQQRSLR